MLPVMGFLGAITFAALTLVLQSRQVFEVPLWFLSAEEYFDLLIVLMASVSSACVIGSVAVAAVAGGGFSAEKKMHRLGIFGGVCFLGGLFGFAVILPLMLLPFTVIGGGIVSVLDLILLIAFFSAVS